MADRNPTSHRASPPAEGSAPREPLKTALRRFVDETVLYRHTDPEREAAFRQHANANSIRYARWIAFAAAAATVLWWPADFLIYADAPDVIRWYCVWRLGNILILSALAALLTWSSHARAHAAAVSVGLSTIDTAFVFWSIGHLGGPEAMWRLVGVLLVPCCTYAVFVPFPQRIVSILMMSTAALAGTSLSFPQYLDYPHIGNTFGLLAFSCLASLVCGHTVYHLSRAAFLANRALARVNESLEEGLLQKTVELRTLATHLESIREDERAQLARELHDDLGQVLTAMRLEVDVARGALRKGRPGDPLTRLQILLDETVNLSRRILGTLRPRILDDFGLVPAIRWLAEEERQRTGLELCLFVAPELPVVAGEKATAVFRSVQEALTNVVKHAAASEVEIRLVAEAGFLELEVRDDGRGIPPRSAWRAGAFGLVSMRERANRLGGSFDIREGDTGGTVLTFRVPFENVGAAAAS
jgi:signal transduction histidine kinase